MKSNSSSLQSRGSPGAVIGHIRGQPSVVGTGLVALDAIYGLEQSHAPGLFAGGTCANVLAALAFLGWRSYPVARLGDDDAGDLVRSDLAACGVQTDFLSLPPQRPTPVVVQRIRIDSEGRVVHRFATRCPGCGGFFPQYQPVPREQIAAVQERVPTPDVVFVDRVSPGGVLLAEVAYERGSLIYFEPSAKCEERLVERMLAVTHILKYSESRVRHFARPLRASLPLEVETQGAAGLRYRGTMFHTGGRAWRSMPGFTIPQLRDAAGAGDWLTAGLLDFVAQAGAAGIESLPRDLVEEGLRSGQALAAWACQFEGARGGMYRESVTTVRDTVSRTLAAGTASAVPAAPVSAEPANVPRELCGSCAPDSATTRPAQHA